MLSFMISPLPFQPPKRSFDTVALCPNASSARLRARVAYDGSGYKGWQFQENCPTIQAVVEEQISRKLGMLVRAVAASRTDTGVHARGQAIHFDVPPEKVPNGDAGLNKFEFTLNQMLPEDIRVKNVSIAPMMTNPLPGRDSHVSGSCPKERPWHSIYNAKGKLYSYRISTAQVFDPMQRLYRYHEWRAARFGFSEELLHAAAGKFVGAHNFSAFTNASRMPPGFTAPVRVNPIRTVHKVDVCDEGNGCYRIDFYIDGAMYKMIRNIMGTVLDIACGKMDLSLVDELFASQDRRLVPKSAPAKGLCLEEVFYEDWNM